MSKESGIFVKRIQPFVDFNINFLSKLKRILENYFLSAPIELISETTTKSLCRISFSTS